MHVAAVVALVMSLILMLVVSVLRIWMLFHLRPGYFWLWQLLSWRRGFDPSGYTEAGQRLQGYYVWCALASAVSLAAAGVLWMLGLEPSW